jgi:hypothetical protein
MKNPENRGNIRGIESIRGFFLAVWKEQNCSSGEKMVVKKYKGHLLM